MITTEHTDCPACGVTLKYYDSVRRTVLTKGRQRYCIALKRFRCPVCRKIHRCIGNDIFPFKHYEAEVIRGVIEGLITPDILGFEDFPHEATMARWMSEFLNGQRRV
ncbi:MAG: DUF6431 domain-containing protein [Ruminococcus sp.]|nr:DUF6431 domain-containing protein [Ruminococcus sp.]